METTAGRTRIGIVFALREEERGLTRVLAAAGIVPRRRGNGTAWSLGRTEVLTAAGGVGRELAARAAREMLEEGADYIVSAGFAGALDPTARAGDIVVPNAVMSLERSAGAVACGLGSVLTIGRGAPLGYSVLRGDLAAVERVICAASEKRAIRGATGAAAVDMESYAVGRLCAVLGAPFAAVRAISDGADRDLPEIVASLDSGGLRKAMLAFSQPAAWPELLRLRRQTITAARNLGDYLSLVLLRGL